MTRKELVNKLSLPLLALSLVLALPLRAEEPRVCSLCAGITSDRTTTPKATVPLLIRSSLADLETLLPYLSQLSSLQKAKAMLAISIPQKLQTVDEAETLISTLVERLGTNGGFDSVSLSFEDTTPEVAAYAMKRMSVSLQGRDLAQKIGFEASSLDQLQKLYETGSQAYFDVLLVPSERLDETVRWINEKDPAKRVYAVVNPTSTNQLYDAAQALSRGAIRAYLDAANTDAEINSVVAFDRELVGDFAFDPASRAAVLDANGTARTERALSFVRGEDLRTIFVTPGDAAKSTIIRVEDAGFVSPRRIDSDHDVRITDTGKKEGAFLVGLPPATSPFFVSLDRTNAADTNIAKESLSVATTKGISVEEIIRNHQNYWSYEKTVEPRYVARNDTRLRFGVAQGGQSVEAAISGPHFFDTNGVNDWTWKDFFINGVKWKYGPVPELPIIQPEKVSQLPLDIHLTNEYRYQLVGEASVRGLKAYEVRFEPPPNAAAGLPLYRGTVWIDQRTWARLRISMIQLNLSGEILSNEERVEYTPFDRTTGIPLAEAESTKKGPKDLLWLPLEVNAQQVLSTAGRSTVVLRATTFSKFQLNPTDFEQQRREADDSPARMVRDTPTGLRYLEKNASGERVVKEGFDSSRMFLLGGLHHDAGLQFPVAPLGGVDYFNFDTFHRKWQSNVFFAGILGTANITNPSLFGTRTNFGADFFGIAIPFQNSMYRGGQEVKGEAVKALPTTLTFRVGHPVLNFGKVDLSLGLSHVGFQRADDTAADFVVPASTFIISPRFDVRYDRWGYSATAFYDYSVRTSSRPWGNLAEYDPNQKRSSSFGAILGKSFYLPNFQRFAVELDYLDGQHLDRFSKFDVGFFGAQRIRGVKSGSLRAEKAVLGHMSYGLVFSQQFRLEAFYDYGLFDDKASGYAREPFQGVGIAGQTLGPYGTLLRVDLGKTVGKNAQSDFVADVVFLKLFNGIPKRLRFGH